MPHCCYTVPLEGTSSTLQILPDEPLIQDATELKEQGNAKVKAKAFSEAATLCERGIEILSLGDGRPIPRQEADTIATLKATLYGNTAQCLLYLEL